MLTYVLLLVHFSSQSRSWICGLHVIIGLAKHLHHWYRQKRCTWASTWIEMCSWSPGATSMSTLPAHWKSTELPGCT